MTEIEQILTDLAQQIMLNNLRHLNQSIEDFNNLLSRDPELALKNLSMLSKEDQQTPPAVIEKMIDIAGWRLPDGTLDTTKIYSDPCCGRGGILAYLHKHYNIPKENLYGIDIKQENVTLCNKLGFNVIKGDALKQETYAKIKNLINQIKGEHMTINRVLMNPPYDGNLHLKVLETTLKAVKQNNPACEVVSIQPARWLEDLLANYKQNSDFKKFKTSIVDNIITWSVVDRKTAANNFGFAYPGDLLITSYNATKQSTFKSLIDPIALSAFSKCIDFCLQHNLKQHVKIDDISGWCVKVPYFTGPTKGGDADKNDSSRTQAIVEVVDKRGPYLNGVDSLGNSWKTYFAHDAKFRAAIEFSSCTEGENFIKSCHTNFYKNLIQLIGSIRDYAPYMEDYSKAWTDEDYCKFFDLTKEESEFMCRKVDDYRVKDFINYINLDEE